MFLLVLNLAFAAFMTGVVWFVQIVHYPLMHEIREPGFRGYEHEHIRKATNVVGPIMVLELAAAAALIYLRPRWISPYLTWGLLIIVLLIWASTFLLQAPCHRRLSNGFNTEAFNRLVATNWIRTALWSLRTVVLTLVSFEAMVA